MFNFIKNFTNIYSSPNQKDKPVKSKNLLSENILDNIVYLRKEFDGSVDLTIREFEISGTKAAIITIEGMINKETFANSVINPILISDLSQKSPIEKYEYIRDNVLSTSEQVQIVTYDELMSFIMSGFAVISLDGCNTMLAIGVQGFSFRGITEPSSEVLQRGSKEGFVEPLRINMTLIRRRIKNPKLKFDTMKIGKLSNTDVCLCYINDMVSPQILQEVKKRLNNITLDSVLASGYISPFLEEKDGLSLFSSVGMSERPDTICGKISEGRIAIIVDGTPNVLIVPYLFVEYFQNMDDYTTRPYFATLTRWLKYISFIVATLLPGIYVAMGTFNPELFPEELLNKIATSLATTPFPLIIEALVIYLVYEIMREAGLRLPKPLGHAVSIVGSLVIGETAVSAGLIGAPTLMIVALTAISSYVIPNLYEPVAILRLIFIIIGGTMGIWGIMLLFSLTVINICSKSNYGVPFSSPVSPFSMFGMRDVIVRVGWKTLSKRRNSVQYMPGSNIKSERENL